MSIGKAEFLVSLNRYEKSGSERPDLWSEGSIARKRNDGKRRFIDYPRNHIFVGEE